MSTLNDITHSHSAELELLNRRIEQLLHSTNSMMSQIVLSLLRTKGKQLRPLLLMMCAKIYGPVDDKVLNAAVAVELIHNASLIHDDVVDNSMTRRNRPTVNAVWDNHVAVLVGDFYTSTAMQGAIATGDIRIVDALCSLGKRLSLGEIDQIWNAREHCLDEENYFKVVDYKTASLFIASAEMGCYAAGAPDADREALSQYAALLGRCFQIRDDGVDYFPSELVGKPTGNDLREGKITLPLLHALADSSREGHQHAIGLLDKAQLDDAEIEWLQQYARDNGGIDYAFEVMKELRDKACAGLDKLPPSEIQQELRELFDFIIDRQF